MRIGFTLISIIFVSAAAYSETWEQTYGTDLPEQALFSLVTEDGGILTCGIFIIDVSFAIISSENAGGIDCMIVRTDSDREMVWAGDYFSGPWVDLAVAGLETDDDCFVFAGVATTTEEGQQNWIFKLDDHGEIVWERLVGTSNDDWTYDMIQSSDGGFLLAGYVDSIAGDGTVISLMKTDAEGNEMWNRQFGHAGTGMAEALIEMGNSDFLIIGSVENPDAGNYTVPFIMRIDSNGNEEWLNTFPGQPGNCYPLDMVEMTDGNIMMTGYSESKSGDYDVWAALVSPDGDPVEQWTYGGDMDDMAFSITSSPDGCVIAGSTASEGAGRMDLWLLCIDDSGEVQWSETHGGPGNEGAEHITPAPGGGFIVSGYTSSKGAGDTDMWVLEVDEEGRMQSE